MTSFQTANQISFKNILSIKKRREAEFIEEEKKVSETSELKTIRWIWDATVQILLDNWIDTKEELLKCDVEKLKEIIKSPLTLKNIDTFIKENNNQ